MISLNSPFTLVASFSIEFDNLFLYVGFLLNIATKIGSSFGSRLLMAGEALFLRGGVPLIYLCIHQNYFKFGI